MLNHQAITALIIDEDPTSTSALLPQLEAAGYRVWATQDAHDGLARLRSSHQQMLAFFHLDLTAYTLRGLDSALILGALLKDASLARHAYIAITESPEAVSCVFGRLLACLAVPILTKPFAAAEVRAALDAVESRLGLARIPDGVPA
jgi:CheY-like chemotaxis protein